MAVSFTYQNTLAFNSYPIMKTLLQNFLKWFGSDFLLVKKAFLEGSIPFGRSKKKTDFPL